MDQALAENAAILTAISMTTAFGLLALLMVVAVLIRLFSTRILGTVEESVAAHGASASDEAREKALVAVIAVSALMDNPERSRGPGGGHG